MNRESTPKYFNSMPGRWVTIVVTQDNPKVHRHDWEGWTKSADELGIVIHGNPIPPIEFIGTDYPKQSPDITFIPWSQIALIHMDQEREQE